MAAEFEKWVAADPLFEIVTPRSLSLVCFRMKSSNELNKALEDTLNESGKLLISHTVIDDKYTLRFAVGGTLTKQEHVLNAWTEIQSQAQKLIKQ
jgi:aromatic-L-amino-acid decarboxylase